MGKLDFSDLNIQVLGPDAAFVRGSFHLTMSDGKQPHGMLHWCSGDFPTAGRSSTITPRRPSERRP